MFWIIGGSEVVVAVTACLHPELADRVETQLYHATWQGFTALDLVMPLFLFVVGAAMPFALTKRIEPGQSLRPVYMRIFRRVALLWVLGMLTQMVKHIVNVEPMIPELFSNTLQAIAVGYLVTSLALLHLRVAGQVVLMVSLIVGYWALLAFVPFPGHPAGTLERYANLPRYVDTWCWTFFAGIIPLPGSCQVSVSRPRCFWARWLGICYEHRWLPRAASLISC